MHKGAYKAGSTEGRNCNQSTPVPKGRINLGELNLSYIFDQFFFKKVVLSWICVSTWTKKICM